jgi:hypothetical protein
MPMESKHWLIFVLCVASCDAQQANDRKAPDGTEKAAPTATVTGHVYLDDTKGPSRKATVYLEPAATLQSDAPPNRSGGQDKGTVTASVETQFDGSYSFTHVAPGSYYVLATCLGYISPFAALSLAQGRSGYGEWTPLGPEQMTAKNRILESLPRLDVQAGAPASADVVLERGGAVSGTIRYDDGGPASGLEVKVLARLATQGKEIWAAVPSEPHSLGMTPTDDRGSYRISGLPTGKYLIEAKLEFANTKTYLSASVLSVSSSNEHAARLFLYSGNTPHEKDAAIFTLQAREERTGEDIVIPMSKLHTIKGTIVSAHDGHMLNSGQVSLFRADDQSLVGDQNLTEDDPSFTFSFVYEGDYILRTPVSADVDYEPVVQPPGSLSPPQFSAHTFHFYGSASQSLHVEGEMEGVTIAVPEPTPKEAQDAQEMMRLEEQQEKPASAPQ